MENEKTKSHEAFIEDELARFNDRYKEVLSSMYILRNALTNELEPLESEQIEDLVEILLERMQENAETLRILIDKFQEFFVNQKV